MSMKNLDTGFGEDFLDFQDAESEDDFFNEEEEVIEEDPKKREEEEDKEPEKKTKTEVDDFFTSEDDDSEGGSDSEEDGPEEEEEEESNKDMLVFNFLKEKGLVDIGEDEEVTEENVQEYLEDSLEDMYSAKIDEVFEDMPPILKQINKFVVNGGNIEDFLNKVGSQNNSELSPDLDLENVDNLETIAKYALKKDGHDDEYIKAQIQFLKDSDNLEKYSTKFYSKWTEERETEREAYLKSIEENKKQEKIERRSLKRKVAQQLSDSINETIGGFNISSKDVKSLPDYMVERTVSVGENRAVTPMQNDLMRILNNPVGAVQIAKLLKTANEDGELNFDEFIENVRTKSVRKIKDDLSNNKTSKTKTRTSKRRNLADYYG